MIENSSNSLDLYISQIVRNIAIAKRDMLSTLLPSSALWQVRTHHILKMSEFRWCCMLGTSNIYVCSTWIGDCMIRQIFDFDQLHITSEGGYQLVFRSHNKTMIRQRDLIFHVYEYRWLLACSDQRNMGFSFVILWMKRHFTRTQKYC